MSLTEFHTGCNEVGRQEVPNEHRKQGYTQYRMHIVPEGRYHHHQVQVHGLKHYMGGQQPVQTEGQSRLYHLHLNGQGSK